MRLKAYFLTILLLVPVLSLGISGPTLVLPAQAANACAGDKSPVVWNETAQRLALVPHYSPTSYWYDDFYYEDDFEGGREPASEPGQEENPLSPEEKWMYQSRSRPKLTPLTDSFHTTMLVGNGSAGVLRLNFTTSQRMTICVTLQAVDGGELSDTQGDVYLMTTSQYDKYVQSYDAKHGGYGWWDVEEALSDIPPEWRSFNTLAWSTFRDSHQYENVDDISFSLSLDSDQKYNSLLDGGVVWEDFYVVVDTWDNVHDDDAGAPNSIVAADVSVVTTPRSVLLPTWTVSLVFLAMIAGLVLTPFIINSRYNKAGLGEAMPDVLVPMLEQGPGLEDPTGD